MSMAILNQGCLQKSKRQTYLPNKAFYRPHIKCRFDMESWLKREEDIINRRFNPAGAVSRLNRASPVFL